MLKAMLLAIGLLSQLPVARFLSPEDYSQANRQRAVHYFAFTGLLLAVIIGSCSLVISSALPDLAASAIILLLWVLITGALHLDGLADCSDALAAGHRDRASVLTILKTPECGAMAVVALVLQLLLKLAFIHALLSQFHVQLAVAIGCALVCARLWASLYMQTTPYAREQGLGIAGPGRPSTAIIVQCCALLTVSFWWLPAGFTAALFCVQALVFFSWRQLWLNRINGYTGDCVGAMIELQETTILCLFTIYFSPAA
ncbi:adenosylcobinamide-GDP ribazoletransferase [Teredinibacter turnerae]|uniref:adenosylcobinamide-GDP ribazoletransferase n=1 Tax=Teredinibacter turnerae TaxID=2426 RepID=UPI0004264988|nr:adenosylcobinamide-GDP ribazoletransferase [Teredinibacter turnerae]